MKQRIIPIAIIVALIAFFSIVGGKDFYDESGSESVAEAKPEGLSAPAAVSVLTAEEAEQANSHAIAFAAAEKEKREPFYSLYQNEHLDTVTFQGTIKSVSGIPDPEKNDYPDCLYALFIELDSVLSDLPVGNNIAYEAIAIVPIMKDQKVIPENVFFPGDKIVCIGTEYEAMPQAIQEIQVSDDIQSFELQQYYVLGAFKISAFINGGKKDFAKREISILPIQTLPRDENASKLRKERIRNEIARVEEKLKRHGGSFSAWEKEYEPIAEKYKKLCDEEWKGWIDDSYFAAGGQETGYYNTKDYINWILPYKKYLEENSIDLIVLRIPSKWDFAARVLASDDFQENPAWVKHYYECLKNDIEIVDPMQEMWDHRFDYPLFYFYQNEEEIHNFEGEFMESARKLSQVLKRYEYKKTDKPMILQEVLIQDNAFPAIELTQYPDGNDRFPGGSPLRFKGLHQDEQIVSIVSNSGAPFLFLSNSMFGKKFMQNVGTSIPHYTSYFLQTHVDWVFQSGMDNGMLRYLLSNRVALNSRKAVIMGGQYNLYRGGPTIPSYVTDKAEKITLAETISFSNTTLIEKDGFEFSSDMQNGITTVKPVQDESTLSFSLDIPSNEFYTHCMIRINLSTINQLRISAKTADSERVLDQVLLPVDSAETKTELCFPLSGISDKILIEFFSRYTRAFSIRNIEIWYY